MHVARRVRRNSLPSGGSPECARVASGDAASGGGDAQAQRGQAGGTVWYPAGLISHQTVPLRPVGQGGAVAIAAAGSSGLTGGSPMKKPRTPRSALGGMFSQSQVALGFL